MCEHMKINGVEKLIPNLFNKKRYVIHIRALDQALRHGLVLDKIYRAIEFKQSVWMKEYIDFNTKLKTAAKNDFEKDFYKLMNNSSCRLWHGSRGVILKNRKNLNNNKKRSHTQLDSRKQVIAFQDRVITINIKEAQHPLK